MHTGTIFGSVKTAALEYDQWRGIGAMDFLVPRRASNIAGLDADMFHLLKTLSTCGTYILVDIGISTSGSGHPDCFIRLGRHDFSIPLLAEMSFFRWWSFSSSRDVL